MYLSKMTAAILDDLDYIVDPSAVSLGNRGLAGLSLSAWNSSTYSNYPPPPNPVLTAYGVSFIVLPLSSQADPYTLPSERGKSRCYIIHTYNVVFALHPRRGGFANLRRMRMMF